MTMEGYLAIAISIGACAALAVGGGIALRNAKPIKANTTDDGMYKSAVLKFTGVLSLILALFLAILISMGLYDSFIR